MAGTPLCIATMSFLAPQISRLVGEPCTQFGAKWLAQLFLWTQQKPSLVESFLEKSSLGLAVAAALRK